MISCSKKAFASFLLHSLTLCMMYLFRGKEHKHGFTLKFPLSNTLNFSSKLRVMLLLVLCCNIVHQNILAFTFWKTTNLYWLVVLAEGGVCHCTSSCLHWLERGLRCIYGISLIGASRTSTGSGDQTTTEGKVCRHCG